MYFSSKNSFFHGIMFHHFHDDNIHKKGQGSIDASELKRIINFIGRANILNAEDFCLRYKEKKLKKNHVCFTFDDGIKSQYDIAIPILEEANIKSFFFIYSSLLTNKPDLLEVHRYFRNNYFNSIDEFYNLFYDKIDTDLNSFFEMNKKKIKDFKDKFPHYSINDIKFRLVRDVFLKKKEYEKKMQDMFKEKNFRPNEHYEKLFMSKNEIIEINNLGHTIGLHSHSHPTLMEKLKEEDQFNEYNQNMQILQKEIGCTISSMSHPCGSYNKSTLKVLRSLNINIGFKQIMTIENEKGMTKINNSNLELARQDHADIMKML